MKILQVSQYFPPDSTFGAENYAYNLSIEIMHQGHEVIVFTSAKDQCKERIDYADYNGLKLTRLYNFSRTHPYKSSKVSEIFFNLLKTNKPDAVHFHHLAGLCSSLPEITSSFKIPVFFTLHDYWNLCSNYHFLKPDNSLCPFEWGDHCADCDFHTNALLDKNAQRERTISNREDKGQFYIQRQIDLCKGLNLAEVIYCPSRFLLEAYKNAGIPGKKLRFSPNGMKINNQKNDIKTRNKQHFVFIGSLSVHKGIDLLLDSFSNLPENFKLDIYGSPGQNQNSFWSQMESNLPSNTKFCGSLKQEQVIQTLSSYQALIIPSIWYENAPLVINEAYLAGIPVICRDIGGMAEMVEDGITGLHFTVGNVEDLTDKIKKINLINNFEYDKLSLRSIENDANEKITDYYQSINRLNNCVK